MESWVHRTGALLGTVFAAVAASAAWAQAPAYPAKPVRLLVPFAAGGATDVPTRILATKLGERMGSPFIIDNRPGAGGAIGTATVARAEPDGYSVLVTATPFVVSPHVYPKLGYDTLKDFAQVAMFASSPNVLVVHPSLGVKSVKELIALARPQPGKLDWASSGVGGGQHLFGELFMSMASIKVTHVSYKGSGAAIADVLGDQVRTARTVIDALHRETVALVKAPDVVDGFRKAGTDVAPSGPEQFRKFVLSEYEKWGKVVRAVGIKPE